ncbi:MAG: potassium channel family protein [Gammaproteobacteria bacterium]|jgi:Trk K+ transport system NAD-binding subunit|nr:potassium channel family protein [Gammaproteobacteria bacterium]
MSPITFLIMRRMRTPLLMLICAYAVAVLGMVLVPGPTLDGVRQQMSFLHAFYFVTYTATTIGFGEIPYAFSDAQRLWATFTIYLTVIPWFYGIGAIISLFQDPAFREARTRQGFVRDVRRIRERYYLVCGFGDTGSLLVKALTERGRRAVAIDIDPQRVNALAIQDYDVYVPGLCADASLPENLMDAGLKSRRCHAVVALTNRDQVNLSVAIAAKLLHPGLAVISRVGNRDAAANMASFDTDHIINPFEAFAEHLAMALRSPGTWLLHEWLSAVPQTALPEPRYPPRGGWIICGYGRFGKAIHREMKRAGMMTVVVEADPDRTGCKNCVRGRGTEEETLAAAGVFDAVGIVAGTDDDANNLSIVMTAKSMNPALFVVIRQNRHANDALFRAVEADLVMHASESIVHEVIALITSPLLSRFLARSRRESNAWANEVLARITAVTEDVVPDIWEVRIGDRQARAVGREVAGGNRVAVGDVLRDPRDRTGVLRCVPLLLARGETVTLMPADGEPLGFGDRLLFCGLARAETLMTWTLQDDRVLDYVLTGRPVTQGHVWRWLERRARRRESIDPSRV